MQTITLMLELEAREFSAMMALCHPNNRSSLATLCESPEQASALMSALDEITWQLASSGHEGAITALLDLNV
jgi:hypothetical protein